MRGRQLQFFNSNDEDNERRKTIILPLDTFILLCVVTALLLIVAFSLGVEKGRKISYISTEKKERLSASFISEGGPTLQVLQSNIPVPKTNAKVFVPAKDVSAKKEEPAVRFGNSDLQVGSRYAVQIATYYQENFAQEELKKIKAKGISAFLLKKNNRIGIFVGYFASKEEAEKNMNVLKKTYRDCILRRF